MPLPEGKDHVVLHRIRVALQGTGDRRSSTLLCHLPERGAVPRFPSYGALLAFTFTRQTDRPQHDNFETGYNGSGLAVAWQWRGSLFLAGRYT